jgi:hypothetical protein
VPGPSTRRGTRHAAPLLPPNLNHRLAGSSRRPTPSRQSSRADSRSCLAISEVETLSPVFDDTNCRARSRCMPQGFTDPSRSPFEFGVGAVPAFPGFAAIYLRGQAYLRSQDGKGAAIEFQKILDCRGTIALPCCMHWPTSVWPAPRARLATRLRAASLPGLLRSLEKRRPRHPHLQASQGGVREAAVKVLGRFLLPVGG